MEDWKKGRGEEDWKDGRGEGWKIGRREEGRKIGRLEEGRKNGTWEVIQDTNWKVCATKKKKVKINYVYFEKYSIMYIVLNFNSFFLNAEPKTPGYVLGIHHQVRRDF